MKQVHNIRLQAICKSEEEAQELLEAVKELVQFEIKGHYSITKVPGHTLTLYILKLWFDRQKPVKIVLSLLQENLSADDKQAINEQAEDLLSDRNHLVFRLNTQKLLDKELLLTANPGLQVKINIAAFPKTQENVIVAAKKLFSYE